MRLVHGCIIQFDHNISFKDRTSTDKFVYCKKDGRVWFRLPYQCGCCRYHIPNWEKKHFVIIGYKNPDVATPAVEQTTLF